MAKIVPLAELQYDNQPVSSKPALYFYQQQFNYAGAKHTQSGIIAGVELDPNQRGVIIPHQQLVPEALEQQLALLADGKLQWPPVRGLYTDFSMKVDEILTAHLATATDQATTFEQNDQTIRLQAITDKAVIDQVQQAIARSIVFIASNQVNYHALLQHATDQATPQYLPMALSNIYHPEMLLLPVHRLVNIKPFRLRKFIKQLEEELEVVEFAVSPDGSNLGDFMQQFNPQHNAGQRLGIDHRRAFGFYAGGGQGYIVKLSDEGAMDRLLPREGYTFALQGLDVFILHYGIFRKMLDIGTEETKVESNIDYATDAHTALRQVDSGQFDLAFFINPVLRDELIAVAAGGELLPAKSTHFYPSFPSGLTVGLSLASRS